MARKDNDKQLYGTMKNGEEFERFLKENGLSMNEAINQGLSMLMLQKMSRQSPDQAGAIDDFILYTNKMVDFYRKAIEHSVLADERARAEVKSQLDGMQTIAELNKKLQNENAELAEIKAKLELQLTEQKEMIKNLKAELAEIKVDADELQILKKRCAELTQEKADILLKHTEEVARLQNENFEKMLEIVKAAK